MPAKNLDAAIAVLLVLVTLALGAIYSHICPCPVVETEASLPASQVD